MVPVVSQCLKWEFRAANENAWALLSVWDGWRQRECMALKHTSVTRRSPATAVMQPRVEAASESSPHPPPHHQTHLPLQHHGSPSHDCLLPAWPTTPPGSLQPASASTSPVLQLYISAWQYCIPININKQRCMHTEPSLYAKVHCYISVSIFGRQPTTVILYN